MPPKIEPLNDDGLDAVFDLETPPKPEKSTVRSRIESDDAKYHLVVDISALMHRAYHGATQRDHSRWTEPTKKKCVDWILRWIHTAKNRHCKGNRTNVILAFDGASPFRVHLYSKYKSSRGGHPSADFNGKACYDIMGDIKREARLASWAIMHKHGYEADDMIATAVVRLIGDNSNNTDEKGAPLQRIVVMSKDKDLKVLATDNTVGFIDDEKAAGVAYLKELNPESGSGILVGLYSGYQYQIFVGDPVDDVPRAMKPLAARKNAPYPLEKLGQSFTENREAVARNAYLMSLRVIEADGTVLIVAPPDPDWGTLLQEGAESFGVDLEKNPVNTIWLQQ